VRPGDLVTKGIWNLGPGLDVPMERVPPKIDTNMKKVKKILWSISTFDVVPALKDSLRQHQLRHYMPWLSYAHK
jgi:hypothetical protein